MNSCEGVITQGEHTIDTLIHPEVIPPLRVSELGKRNRERNSEEQEKARERERENNDFFFFFWLVIRFSFLSLLYVTSSLPCPFRREYLDLFTTPFQTLLEHCCLLFISAKWFLTSFLSTLTSNIHLSLSLYGVTKDVRFVLTAVDLLFLFLFFVFTPPGEYRTVRRRSFSLERGRATDC
eukprot:gene9832-6905_t